MAKYFYQHFQIFSIFIYNESLPMKSYQFFKIYKHFDKEKDKTLMQQSMRKEKLRNLGLCFITGCFIKSFNMITIFLFCKLIHSPIFAFWYQDDKRNIKSGSRRPQKAKNGKLQYLFQKQFQSFSNEYNTNKFSFLTKCASIKRLIKFNHSLGARDGFTQPIFYKRFDRFSL